MDLLTQKQRSDRMKLIKSKDTGPEKAVRRLIYNLGFRYRLHVATLPGKPDIVFRRPRKIVFVHGCFWHQHSICRDGRIPNSRQQYWKQKLERNVQTYTDHTAALEKLGWQVLVIWECMLKDEIALKKSLAEFLSS